jgi:uncharacterized protein (DUF4415 family)
MKPTSHKPAGRSDWGRVPKDSESAPIPYDPEDGPYDPNDERAVERYWDQATVVHQGKVIRRGRGPQKAPKKERITIRLSPEVVQHFRSIGKGWQARMDAALQEWIERRAKKQPGK